MGVGGRVMAADLGGGRCLDGPLSRARSPSSTSTGSYQGFFFEGRHVDSHGASEASETCCNCVCVLCIKNFFFPGAATIESCHRRNSV